MVSTITAILCFFASDKISSNSFIFCCTNASIPTPINSLHLALAADTLIFNGVSLLLLVYSLSLTSDAGRRLAQLSVANAALKNVGAELSGIAPKDDMATGLLRGYQDGAYKLDNIRRGLLVSQIATSMRNFTAQVGRVGMHTLSKTMDNALNATFNPMRRLFGVDEKPIDYTDSFNLLLNLTSDKKFAKESKETLN